MKFNLYDFELFLFYVLGGTLIYIFGSYAINYDLKNYRNKAEIYEKIVNREYDRTFDSYEDYLLYRIEIGK